MKLSRESFLHYIQVVCNRPQIYTRSGTFGEVIAFIMGMALGSRVHGDGGSHTGITDFSCWLEQKVGNHPDFEWWTLNSFRAMYPDDESALRDFAKYYKDFCDELPDEEDEIEITLTESKSKELADFIRKENRFSEVVEIIELRLDQNSNNRDFLSSDYNIFKDKK